MGVDARSDAGRAGGARRRAGVPRRALRGRPRLAAAAAAAREAQAGRGAGAARGRAGRRHLPTGARRLPGSWTMTLQHDRGRKSQLIIVVPVTKP